MLRFSPFGICFFGIEKLEGGSDSDSEIELGLEDREEVGGYNSYTSFRYRSSPSPI